MSVFRNDFSSNNCHKAKFSTPGPTWYMLPLYLIASVRRKSLRIMQLSFACPAHLTLVTIDKLFV